MNSKRTVFVIIIALIVAVLGGLGIALFASFGSSAASFSAEDASSTVASFGTHLNEVSLLAPDASSTIASAYGPYATPELLQSWEDNPEQAPGRLTSSPWPDHIRIDSVSSQGSGYVVNGTIILMTSNEIEHGGNAGEIPVVVQLVPQDGKLLIAAYQQQLQQ